jgi:hypothetical protein
MASNQSTGMPPRERPDGKNKCSFVTSTETNNTRLEHFWLCGECSKRKILTCVNHSGVKTMVETRLQ